MKALICTAGEGKRLRPLTVDKPKSLIKIGEKTILEYMLDNISEAGIRDVVLVVGYKEDKVRGLIGYNYNGLKIKYYINREYFKTDNMYSLWMARKEIDGGIVFFNADILFHPEILKKLMESGHSNAVAVDDSITLVDDSMKVKLEAGKIKAISKKVKPGDGWAMGIYKFSPEGAKQYYEVVRKLVETGAPDASFVKPVEIMSQKSDIYAVSTGGHPWAEVDNFDDLEAAKKKIHDIVCQSPTIQN